MAVKTEPSTERCWEEHLVDEWATSAGVAVEGIGVDVVVDVATRSAVELIVNVAGGVGVTVLTHPAIISEPSKKSSVSNKYSLFIGPTFLRGLDRSA